MSNSMSIITLLLSSAVVATNALTWSACGTNLDCTTLSVPLEYGVSTSTAQASIALVRYKATVSSSQRLGSLLVNPGGPGASGASFVQNGAGSAVSTLTGGLYDIIGWDPRGVGKTTPLLECFPNASAEYDFTEALPGGPNLWLGMFSNSSYDAEVKKRISAFDTSVAGLSKACAAQNSPALYTSSAAYVAKDMDAIVTALDGSNAKLNYWGFSYGTIYLTEFIQAFPKRVGRIVADGVFDAEANALTYDNQLPNDQTSARDAINDLISSCEAAGSNCPLSTPPKGVTATLTKRIDNLFESLFLNPIDYFGTPISLDSFNSFLSSLIILPATWSLVANIIQGLELRNATLLVNFVSAQAAPAPADPSAPGVGKLSQSPLLCIDNAPSSSITLDKVVKLTKSISIKENTPFLSAGLLPITFCRNFPDTRPLLKNAGVSLMSKTDAILKASNTTVLIVNPNHDPSTPLKSAKKLRSFLPNSSRIAIRGGSGHTTISLASLSMSQTIHDFFVSGALPTDGKYHNADQNVFPAGSGGGIVSAPAFNGTYTADQTKILQATYGLLAAFISLA